jgi:hypothetical protein
VIRPVRNQQIGAETAGSFQAELQHLFVDGRGHVMSVHRATAERAGKKLDAMGGIMFRIIDDKATDLDEYEEDMDVANEFWA